MGLYNYPLELNKEYWHNLFIFKTSSYTLPDSIALCVCCMSQKSMPDTHCLELLLSLLKSLLSLTCWPTLTQFFLLSCTGNLEKQRGSWALQPRCSLLLALICPKRLSSLSDHPPPFTLIHPHSLRQTPKNHEIWPPNLFQSFWNPKNLWTQATVRKSTSQLQLASPASSPTLGTTQTLTDSDSDPSYPPSPKLKFNQNHTLRMTKIKFESPGWARLCSPGTIGSRQALLATLGSGTLVDMIWHRLTSTQLN